MIGAQSAFALSQHQQTAYRSGFTYGVVDGKAGCLGRCHWYILQLGKGFAFHSREFINGYINGFCSVSPYASIDYDEAGWDCAKGPSSANWYACGGAPDYFGSLYRPCRN